MSSGAISPAFAPASIDMLHTVMRPSIESARMAEPRYSAMWPMPPPVPMRPRMARMTSFAVEPAGSDAVDGDRQRLGRLLRQRLRGEHVLDLARADAERQRAERAVGRRVAVAAHDRHAGQRQALLRPDHVDDALARVAHRVVRRGRTRRRCARSVSICLRADRVGDRLVDVARSGRCGPRCRP